jgi:hypothetical protein
LIRGLSGHVAGVLNEVAQLERTTVAGLPAWWAPAPGPVVGALMFRTGRADETLATAGITHLVEHLALFALGRREHAVNGFVDDDRCVLYASGTLDEVATFLRDVAAALRALPVDRLPLERRLLRTEAAQRDAPGVVPRLLSHRYGAAGYGLTVYEEIGLRWLGPDEIRAWAAERFTLENAVLWLSAEPPPGLELPLPAGRRTPVPAPDPLPITYPAAVQEGTGGMAVGGIARRSTALGVAAAVVAERLVDRLRLERGLAYQPSAAVEPLTGELAHVVLATDCLDEHAPAVRDELWRVACEVAEHGATAEELERHHAATVRAFGHPDAVRGELDEAAHGELLGREHVTAADVLERIAGLDGPATAAPLAEALAEPIFIVPMSAAGPDGFRPHGLPEPEPVSGTRYRPPRTGALRRRARDELVVGAEGMTWHAGKEHITLPWSECVAAEQRVDGSVVFIRRDDGWLLVDPSAFEAGAAALDEALSRLPPGRLVPEIAAEAFEALLQAGARSLDDEVRWELRALPGELGVGELPLALVAAQYGLVVGLLTITDGRFIWLCQRKDGLQRIGWRWASLARADARSVGELRVTPREGGTESFTVTPIGRTRELAGLIAAQIAAAGA